MTRLAAVVPAAAGRPGVAVGPTVGAERSSINTWVDGVAGRRHHRLPPCE